jgi:biopolymer transport protein ExbD
MFRRPKRPSLSIDMAPLIDVVFLLLVFFMLTSSFVPPAIPLALPQATSQAAGEAAKVVVSLNREGQISIGENVVENAQFETVLKNELEQNKTTAVHFRGDKTVDYGIFLELISRARATGAQQFNLVHDPAAP